MKQAIASLEDVFSFFDSKGHTFLAGRTMKLTGDVTEAHHSSLAAARQTRLQELFTMHNSFMHCLNYSTYYNDKRYCYHCVNVIMIGISFLSQINNY